MCLLAMGGCTVIGLSLSQSLKDQNKVSKPISGQELRELSLGTEIRVALFRGGFYTGPLRGLDAEPDSVYALRYEKLRGGSGHWLPELGESIRVINGLERVGEFRSFDYDGVRLRHGVMGAGLAEVSEIQATGGGGASIPGEVLRELSQGGMLPFQSSIRMETQGQLAKVSTDKVLGVYRQQSAAWVWIPFAMGIVADVGLLYFAGNAAWGD